MPVISGSTPAVAARFLLSGIWRANGGVAGAQFVPLASQDMVPSVTEAQNVVPVPGAYRLLRLRAILGSEGLAAAETFVLTVRLNEADTALTVTYADGDAVGLQRTIAANVDVVAGDRLCMELTGPGSGNPVRVAWSVELEAR